MQRHSKAYTIGALALLLTSWPVSVSADEPDNAGDTTPAGLSSTYYDGQSAQGSWQGGNQITNFKYGASADVTPEAGEDTYYVDLRFLDHEGETFASAFTNGTQLELLHPNKVGISQCRWDSLFSGLDPHNLHCIYYRYRPGETGPGEGDLDLFPPPLELRPEDRNQYLNQFWPANTLVTTEPNFKYGGEALNLSPALAGPVRTEIWWDDIIFKASGQFSAQMHHPNVVGEARCFHIGPGDANSEIALQCAHYRQ